MYDHLKINSTVYAVHNKHASKKLEGGVIQVCKVKTFYNYKEKILPKLKVVGSTAEINPTTHQLFINLSCAIDAIRS
jgi:hypothetical protein